MQTSAQPGHFPRDNMRNDMVERIVFGLLQAETMIGQVPRMRHQKSIFMLVMSFSFINQALALSQSHSSNELRIVHIVELFAGSQSW